MSDTPQTDAALKVLSTMKIPYNAWNDASFVYDFAHKQMSDTPRTDVMENNKEVVVDCAFLFFARQLERELAALRSDNLTAHKMACAAGIERDTLRAELAATQHLLHESLGREDRFYRELAAKSAVTTDHVVGTD